MHFAVNSPLVLTEMIFLGGIFVISLFPATVHLLPPPLLLFIFQLKGFLSDTIEAPVVSSLLFLLLSVPALVFYRTYGSVSMLINIALMFISGLLVNGPYALITTAVATDLGTQSVIKGNSRALATVSAIIDGTGSVGAAIGPLLAGYISTRGWNSVFFMLIVSILMAGLLLIHLVKNEIKGKLNEGKWLWFSLIVH